MLKIYFYGTFRHLEFALPSPLLTLKTEISNLFTIRPVSWALILTWKPLLCFTVVSLFHKNKATTTIFDSQQVQFQATEETSDCECDGLIVSNITYRSASVCTVFSCSVHGPLLGLQTCAEYFIVYCNKFP